MRNDDQIQHSRLLVGQNPDAATRQRSPNTDELILIVEMNEWTSGSLPLQLRQVGHDVRVAQGKKSGSGAVETCASASVDCGRKRRP